jgi:hypothetical protein
MFDVVPKLQGNDNVAINAACKTAQFGGQILQDDSNGGAIEC